MSNGYNLIQATQGSTTNTEYRSGEYASVPTETLTWSHDGSEFVPSQLVLQKGKHYTIDVTPTANGQGCVSAVAVP